VQGFRGKLREQLQLQQEGPLSTGGRDFTRARVLHFHSMGGSAFADPKDPSKSLHTPRMPPHIYKHVRDSALRLLRSEFFAQAECPIEAPAKIDHGDVDILVASPRERAHTDVASLAAALGATQYKKNGPTTNFALSWPTVQELSASVGTEAATHWYTADAETPTAKEQDGHLSCVSGGNDCGARHDDIKPDITDPLRYVQLDLHFCPTPEQFQWELFHQAHGDLWNILGGMIRPYGLIVNHIGFYLRLAGIENISRDRRTIQLTTSPSAVLKFLDLDEKNYWTRFESVDTMFSYAASCRFYDPKAYKGKEDFKANDRLRMKKRPVFMKWYEGFLKEHTKDPPGRTAGADRQEVIEEAKKVFGVEKEYEEKRAKGLRIMGEEKLWSDIRKGLPVEGLRIGVVMRGVKREVLGGTLPADPEMLSGERKEPVGSTLFADADEWSGTKRGVVRKKLSDMQQAYLDGRFDEVADWVKTDWEDIERRQNAYERRQSIKHLLAKPERDRDKKADMETCGPGEGMEITSTFETAKMQEALAKNDLR
jgi:hypothetical protein